MHTSTDWGLADTLTVTDVVTAAGGIAQTSDEADAVVYLELTCVPSDEGGPPATYRIVIPLDLYFPLMVALEHAGKVAMLMPV